MTLTELARTVGVWVEDVELLQHRGIVPAAGLEGYQQHHIDILSLVSRMRGTHRLSLDTIEAILVREYQYDTTRAEQSLMAFVEPNPRRQGIGPATRQQLLQGASVTQDIVEALVDRGMVPCAGPYSGHHQWLCEAVGALLSASLTWEQVDSLILAAKSAADREAGLVERALHRAPERRLSAVRSCRERVGELLTRARYVGQRRRLGYLALAAGSAGTLASVRFYRPSPLFCARHGIEEWNFSPDTAEDSFRLGRLALGIGRLSEALSLLEHALRHQVGPKAKVCATLAVTRALTGDTVGAKNAALVALEESPEAAVVSVYCALAFAISAPSTTNSLVCAAWMETALSLLERSFAGEWEDEGERLEVALARGRLGLVIPTELGFREQAREDLEWVRERTRAAAEPGTTKVERQLLRINALYFLGMDWDDQGDALRAREMLAEVAWIDPTSEFARQSWLRLQRPRF